MSSTNENDTLKDILLSDNLLDSIMNEQSDNIKTEMEGLIEKIFNYKMHTIYCVYIL